MLWICTTDIFTEELPFLHQMKSFEEMIIVLGNQNYETYYKSAKVQFSKKVLNIFDKSLSIWNYIKAFFRNNNWKSLALIFEVLASLGLSVTESVCLSVWVSVCHTFSMVFIFFTIDSVWSKIVTDRDKEVRRVTDCYR